MTSYQNTPQKMTDVSTELTWYIGDNSLFCATFVH